MNVLQEIFNDYYDEIKYTLHPRKCEPENIEKMIRYGGLYVRHHESDKKPRRAISKEKHAFFLSFNQWCTCILFSFGCDPLKCPECGATMLFPELSFGHRRVSLEELYGKVMSKSHGKRSSA